LLTLVVTALATAPLVPVKAFAPDFADADFWLALLGGAGYLALIGALSLAIGAIIRNSAGGIAASLGLILVVPTIVQILASLTRADWARHVGPRGSDLARPLAGARGAGGVVRRDVRARGRAAEAAGRVGVTATRFAGALQNRLGSVNESER